MKTQHKKRRKYRDPETCCTPPLAEDMLWATLDDDPLGIYNSLGGRSTNEKTTNGTGSNTQGM